MKRKSLIYAVVAMLMSVLCGGCRATRTIYQPIEIQSAHTDTLRTLMLRADTVRERDSVTLIQRGDTVWHTRYLWRERISLHRDTLYKSVRDTVYRQVKVSVDKPLTRWQRVKQTTGGYTIVLLGVMVLLIIYKLIKKLRNCLVFKSNSQLKDKQ